MTVLRKTFGDDGADGAAGGLFQLHLTRLQLAEDLKRISPVLQIRSLHTVLL